MANTTWDKTCLYVFHADTYADLHEKDQKAKQVKLSSAYTRKRYKNDPVFRKHINRLGTLSRKKRIKHDVIFRIKVNCRKRLRAFMRRHSLKKNFSVSKSLGCTLPQFKDYISRQFDIGMSFSNYGKVWCLDHRIPLSFFDLTNEIEFKIANHYTNLQPLTIADNNIKSDSLEKAFLAEPIFID